MRVPGFLKPIAEIYVRAGYRCVLVGGAVRNMVLHQQPKDYDLATDAPPEATMRLFNRVIPTGVKHGTVTILFKGRQFEVTTFRKDQEYSDGRRPDSVEYTDDLFEDLARRDFTINAMALDLVSGEFVDVHGGVEDVASGTVRAIGIPSERFNEDGLRLMRAVRFAAQLDFRIEADTLSAMKALHRRIAVVSWERIRDELEKTILSEHPARGLVLTEEAGLLAYVLPELQACVGVPQAGEQDVFRHSVAACEGASKSTVLRLAALLHDVGKAPTLQRGPEGELSFHRHEQVSADMARTALTRLRFPNAVIDRASHLIANHMFHYTQEWSDAAVRRFVARVGLSHVDDLLELRRADTFGKTGTRGTGSLALRRRIDDVLSKTAALTVKDLAVNGNDLHSRAGIPRGPEMGSVLSFLLETVLDDPSLNHRDRLLSIAERFYTTRVRVSDDATPPSR